MLAAGFSWFRLIPAVDHDEILKDFGLAAHSVFPDAEVANTTVHLHAWFAVAVLLTLAVLGRMGLERAKRRAGV